MDKSYDALLRYLCVVVTERTKALGDLLVLLDDATFSADDFSAFLAAQDDLGPKQWPRFVRVAATLPRTETFKVIKRQLSAEGTDCVDPVFAIAR